jgi:hypothetical protein
MLSVNPAGMYLPSIRKNVFVASVSHSHLWRIRIPLSSPMYIPICKDKVVRFEYIPMYVCM